MVGDREEEDRMEENRVEEDRVEEGRVTVARASLDTRWLRRLQASFARFVPITHGFSKISVQFNSDIEQLESTMKRACLPWTVSVVCATFCVAFLDAGEARNSRDVCRRDSPDTSASKTPGDNGFRIKFAGRPPPERYTAGQVYTVGISGTYSNQKLLGFMLVAVPENARDETTTMGTFQEYVKPQPPQWGIPTIK
ncbi:hypothetical protein LSAT2_020079 [Lamellibrachia satsuma]|nr:hypothetical protein LSAT2_020079 [Lamellibrachia satsuma]